MADEETGALLTPAEHRDPLRNRGLLRTPLAPAVSTQDADLFLPFGRRPAA
ncbi:hypothetical protein ABTY98_36035 [Streptomyces sp. NPDC096040]|uniref:hypothetical protein n=1 Tax=Streptomyces sp. NPDC096040 TaxID=3155541 RepID=UPI003325BCDA